MDAVSGEGRTPHRTLRARASLPPRRPAAAGRAAAQDGVTYARMHKAVPRTHMASRSSGHERSAPPPAGRRAAYDLLVRAARAARRRAYAPYSQFPVGAAALAADGSIYAGANVENASYGLTQCAERVAIQNAVAAGRRALRAVAVAGPDGISPCGACRQVMAEFGIRTVLIAGPSGRPAVVPFADLLPRPFGRSDLRRAGRSPARSASLRAARRRRRAPRGHGGKVRRAGL
jgi:cytidine deaminase